MISVANSLRVATRVGITAMRVNPIRALLATLGVVIGSGALVSVLAVSDGVEKYARMRVSRQGFDRVNVRSITQDTLDGQFVARPHVAALSPADVGSVANDLLAGERATLTQQGVVLAELRGSSRPRALVIRSVEFSLPDSLGETLLAGRFLTPDETSGNSAVAVINLSLARALVGDTTNAAARALGDSVHLGEQQLRVVGVAAMDEVIAINRSALVATVPMMVGSRGLARATTPPAPPLLTVSTTAAENTRAMRRRVEQWLGSHHGEWTKDFRVEARTESQLADIQRGLLIFRLLMGSITGITLIVGGIGIMNVLLASVAERTREIGVRKAVGARRRDILLQFLAESVTITGVGSAIGTVVGLAAAYGVTAVMRHQTQAVIFAATTPRTLAISIGLAVLVGLVFGCYPAARAARLAPIDAIHTE